MKPDKMMNEGEQQEGETSDYGISERADRPPGIVLIPGQRSENQRALYSILSATSISRAPKHRFSVGAGIW
jgi:hypothetical protein